MSCTTYVHNDPIGGSKYVSGTTCTGTVAYYTLTLGQSICMDNSKPLINLNGLVISGDCTGVTPTPTPTPIDFCYLSGFTYKSAIFQCPNNGQEYFDTYGVWTFSAYTGSQFTNNHPQLNFTLTNGTDYATVTIESNQYFTEFIYPKVNFEYTATGCTSTTYPDWYISGPPTTQCFLTPTPTQTPTLTKTPTLTPTPTLTQTNTSTPTPTAAQCKSYTATKLSTFLSQDSISYTDCYGIPQIQYLENPPNTYPESATFCAIAGTLTYNDTQISVVDNGTCIPPTPTVTSTPTITPTITITPSITSTIPLTPSITPTISLTPNAICPEQLTLSESNYFRVANGTYDRVYISNGVPVQYGYLNQVGNVWTTGSSPTGKNYPFYTYYSAPYWYTIYAAIATFDVFNFWEVERQITPIWSGGTYDTLAADMDYNYIEVSGVRYVPQGRQDNYNVYVTYPSVCPTTTPTPSLTSTPFLTPSVSLTPSITPTNTQTPTITPTITNTVSITPTITKTQTPTITPTTTIVLTPSVTPTLTPTRTQTPTITPTISLTPSVTKTPTQTSNLGLYWDVNIYDCLCNLVQSNAVLRTNQNLSPSSTNFVSFDNYPNYIFKILSSITWPGYHDVQVLNFTAVYSNANCNLIPC